MVATTLYSACSLSVPLLSLCITLLCLCTLAAASSSESYPNVLTVDGGRHVPSPVIKLQQHSFNNMIGKPNHIFLVQFYNSRSKSIEKEWTDAAKSLQGFMPLTVVDCDAEHALCSLQHVDQLNLPEVRFYKAGDEYYGKPTGQVYTQSKEAKPLVAFALLSLRNPTSLSSAASYASDLQGSLVNKPVAVTLYSDKRSTPSIYKSLAMTFQDDFTFFELRTNDAGVKDLAKALGITKFPSLVFQAANQQTTRFEGEWGDILAMRKWLQNGASKSLGREYQVKTESVFPSPSSIHTQSVPQQPKVVHTEHPTPATRQSNSPPPIVGAPTPHPERTENIPDVNTKREVAPVEPVGAGVESDIEALRANPHVTFPDENDETLKLPELSDQSCYESYCDTTQLSSRDHRLCLILVIYPSQTTEDQIRTKKLFLREIAKEKGNKRHAFAWIDGEKQNFFLTERFQMQPSSQPKLLLINGRKHLYIPYENEHLSKPVVLKWLDAVYENRVPYKRMTAVSPGVYTELTTSSVNCPKAARSFVNDDESAVIRNAKPPNTVDEGQMLYIETDNFKELIRDSKQPWILLFCNSIEQACTPILSSFMNSARVLRNQVKYGYVDTTLEPELAQIFGIHQLPAVRYWNQHSQVKTESNAQLYIGSLSNALFETSLNTHAQGLLDANLVNQVFEHTFSEWMGSANDADSSLDDFVIRVMLFNYAPTIPTYIQALSYKWQHVIYFGVTIHSQSQLVSRFDVTQIPSMYFFKVPRRLSEQQKANIDLVQFQATKYTGVLTFNHIDAFCEELYQNLKEIQHGTYVASSATPRSESKDEL